MKLKDAIEWLQKGVDDGFLPEEMALPIVMDAARDMLALGEARKLACQREWTYEPQEFMPERIWAGPSQIAHVIGDSAETEDNARFIVTAANLAQKWGGDV